MIILAAVLMAQFLPGQPYASYWHPADLLSWSPNTDPDAPYNRSAIPLATRSLGDTQCNAHAIPGQAGVTSISIMYPSTSFNPSQGGPGIDTYAFGYWQYIEHLTFWGGSAGEGLILAPNPGVTDAAHRNGVPVYGTVFFPPVQYGGQIQWVWDFVQKEGDTFPVADKLIEVAEYYGFDGWFINQETAGGNTQLAEDMRDMMIYIQLNSDLRIQWYDAMTKTGAISWQNALNANNDWFFQYEDQTVSDEMFLNFWWSSAGLTSSGNHAIALGRSPYDLYAGVDVQSNGYNTGVNWEGLFPEGQDHRASLGFYCPNWTYSNASSHAAFYSRESYFWVGPNRDPGNTGTTYPWKGIAHYIPAKTPVTSFPFVTSFNTGQGYRTAVEGEVLSQNPWHNRSQMDVLPTWRYISNSGGTPLYPELDWEIPYHGGSCLKVGGELSPANTTMLYLYKTDAPVQGDDSFVIVWNRGEAAAPSGMEVALSTTSDPMDFFFFQVPDGVSEGWNTWQFPLSALAGHTLSIIALRFQSPTVIEDYQIRIGRLGVIRGEPVVPAPPTGLVVEQFNQVDDFNGTLRLRWDPSDGDNYMVYSLNSDESRTFLWATPGNACFVPLVTRPEGEDVTTVLVVANSNEFGYSEPAVTQIVWTTTGIEGEAVHGTPVFLPGLSNPVSGMVEVEFSVPSPGHVELMVFDLAGRIVDVLHRGELSAGGHTASWNTNDLPCGVYIQRVSGSGGCDLRKTTVLR
jgi:mannosyl-glycoprotein endo-beta-N-acetylglucosaminidase